MEANLLFYFDIEDELMVIYFNLKKESMCVTHEKLTIENAFRFSLEMEIYSDIRIYLHF